jgi:hypothetical protein
MFDAFPGSRLFLEGQPWFAIQWWLSREAFGLLQLCSVGTSLKGRLQGLLYSIRLTMSKKIMFPAFSCHSHSLLKTMCTASCGIISNHNARMSGWCFLVRPSRLLRTGSEAGYRQFRVTVGHRSIITQKVDDLRIPSRELRRSSCP